MLKRCKIMLLDVQQHHKESQLVWKVEEVKILILTP